MKISITLLMALAMAMCGQSPRHLTDNQKTAFKALVGLPPHTAIQIWCVDHDAEAKDLALDLQEALGPKHVMTMLGESAFDGVRVVGVVVKTKYATPRDIAMARTLTDALRKVSLRVSDPILSIKAPITEEDKKRSEWVTVQILVGRNP